MTTLNVTSQDIPSGFYSNILPQELLGSIELIRYINALQYVMRAKYRAIIRYLKGLSIFSIRSFLFK